jgi:organic radical activating enzyme
MQDLQKVTNPNIEYIKECDVDHKVNRLYIHWDIIPLCNYHCYYCYAQKEYKGTSTIPNSHTTSKIIKAISKSSLPVFLGLLGGEPTLHPRYFNILDQISNEILVLNDQNRVYVTSNTFKPISFWEKHKNVNRTSYMLWSVHPQYEENYKDFIDKVLLMRSKGYKMRINVLMSFKKEHWLFMHKILEQLFEIETKENPKVEIHPHFFYLDIHNMFPYKKEFWQEFVYLKDRSTKYLTFTDKLGNSCIKNDYEVFTKDINHFKGWLCYHNNYEVNPYGKVTRLCVNEHDDLITNQEYFAKIRTIKPIVCQYDSCNCDGLLKIRKEKTVDDKYPYTDTQKTITL